MTKFESGVKMIPAPQELVYEKLADLNNLEKLKDNLPEDKVKNLSFDADSLSIEVASLPLPPRRCRSICGYRLSPHRRRNARSNLLSAWS